MRCYIKVSLNSTLKKDDDVDIIDFEASKYDNINRNNMDNKNCTLNDYHKVASVDLCQIHIENGFIISEPCEQTDEPTTSTNLSTILSSTNSETNDNST